MAERIRLYEKNTDERKLNEVVSWLERDGVIVYPTDTVYALGCNLQSSKGFERIARIKGIKPEKADFSLVFNDLSMLSEFALPLSTPHYKLLKRALPGPYTFLLAANNRVPKLFKRKKSSIGIRIPDNEIARAIVEKLGVPLITTSVHDDDEIIEYTTDPELILERYDSRIDVMIDGGFGDNAASTIIDLTHPEPEVIREGKGSLDVL